MSYSGLIRVLLISLALCAGPTPSNAQNMFRGNAAHTGVYPGRGPREFHRIKWSFVTGSRVIGSPVSFEKAIYFGSDDGNVYALDAATGRELWRAATRGPVPCTPAIVNGTIYFGSYDGKFYALDARTGNVKWKF